MAIAGIVAASLLVACEGEPDDSGPASPAGGTPAGTSTPTPGAPPPPIDTATPTATVEASVPYGLAIIDVATGEATTLYEDSSASFLMRAHNGEIVGTDGTIWLSPDTGHSVRYAPDGTVVDEIEGWGVLEAPGGTGRSYFAGDDPPVTLLVEHDGDRYELPAGGATWRAYSPDGTRLAWTSPADPQRGTLHLLDLATGETTEVTTGAAPPLAWSPSGRLLAFGSSSPGQTTLLDLERGEQTAARGNLHGGEAWVEIDGVEWVVTLDGSGARITSADSEGDAEGEPVEFPFPGGDSVSALGGQYIVVTAGTGATRTTVAFDAADGSQVLELHGEADIVATGSGLASAVIARTELACTGIEIVHPLATQRLPCEADYARWSPDGRYLALIPTAASAPVEVLDLATGESRELPHTGPRGTAPAWSADGRHLVWTWMPLP